MSSPKSPSTRRRSPDRRLLWAGRSSASGGADAGAAARRAGLRRGMADVASPSVGAAIGGSAWAVPVRPVVTPTARSAVPTSPLVPALHSPQLGDEQVQAFDFGLPPRQLFVFRLQLLALYLEFGLAVEADTNRLNIAIRAYQRNRTNIN